MLDQPRCGKFVRENESEPTGAVMARPEKLVPLVWLLLDVGTIAYCAWKIGADARGKRWRSVGLGILAAVMPLYFLMALVRALPGVIVD
jgi:hypothetical protein